MTGYGVWDDKLSLISSSFSSHQETERLVADSPPGIEAHPHEDNLRYFDVKIRGPDGSAFEGMSRWPRICRARSDPIIV